MIQTNILPIDPKTHRAFIRNGGFCGDLKFIIVNINTNKSSGVYYNGKRKSRGCVYNLKSCEASVADGSWKEVPVKFVNKYISDAKHRIAIIKRKQSKQLTLAEIFKIIIEHCENACCDEKGCFDHFNNNFNQSVNIDILRGFIHSLNFSAIREWYSNSFEKDNDFPQYKKLKKIVK